MCMVVVRMFARMIGKEKKIKKGKLKKKLNPHMIGSTFAIQYLHALSHSARSILRCVHEQ